MERTVFAAGDGVLRLAMWSGPRNISTAFMRSWENRGDTIVVDEPFYAHYLKVTGLDHPGRDEIIAHQESDWRRVADALLAPVPANIRVFYQKQMSHHLLPHMGRAWLDSMTHAFLIRDPLPMLVSLGEKLTNFDLLATGLPQQVEIFEHVILRTGKVPAVLDSADLLERPEPMLRALCDAVGVPFTDRMLWWPAGRRESDGIWARHWYDRVEQSTGFETPSPQPAVVAAAKPLPPAAAEIEARCRPLYERLRAHRLRARGDPVLQKFDERNRNLIVNVSGELVHRDQARISPFDSSVQGGDAVWEGLRLYRGRIFRLEQHLDRLVNSAKALAFAQIPTREAITREISRTLEANGMFDGVHIRLTLTRGVKITSGMDPRLNTQGPTLIVLAEHKAPVYGKGGLSLVTSSVRRFPPDCLDPKIHSNNLIQSILAKIEANVAGADDALMLDQRGFIAETNATHVFLIERGLLRTPRLVACPEGITRSTVLELCLAHAIAHEEVDLTLTQAYCADEMFCTGTMGELAAVTQVDGRQIGDGQPGPLTQRLSALFRELTTHEGTLVTKAPVAG